MATDESKELIRWNIYSIDDTDNRGLRGQIGGSKGEAGFFAAAPVDGLAGSGADGVQRHDGASFVAALAVQRLNDEELLPDEGGILHRADDVSDDASKMHFIFSVSQPVAHRAARRA